MGDNGRPGGGGITFPVGDNGRPGGIGGRGGAGGAAALDAAAGLALGAIGGEGGEGGAGGVGRLSKGAVRTLEITFGSGVLTTRTGGGGGGDAGAGAGGTATTASTTRSGVGAGAGAGVSTTGSATAAGAASATGSGVGSGTGAGTGSAAATGTGAGAGSTCTTGTGVGSGAATTIGSGSGSGDASTSTPASGEAFAAFPPRVAFTTLISSGCSLRVNPSRSARRRIMSQYASCSDDEWLFTPIARSWHRSRASLFVIPSSFASSCNRMFFGTFWSQPFTGGTNNVVAPPELFDSLTFDGHAANASRNACVALVDTGRRNARSKRRRRTASSTHFNDCSHNQAPLPGSDRLTLSEPSSPSAQRSNWLAAAWRRQPTHVRMGSGRFARRLSLNYGRSFLRCFNLSNRIDFGSGVITQGLGLL